MNIPSTQPTAQQLQQAAQANGGIMPALIQINQDTNLYECHSCHRRFPSQRYAQHLEKCLGMGRQTRTSRF
jgi:hypothetical protein